MSSCEDTFRKGIYLLKNGLLVYLSIARVVEVAYSDLGLFF